MKEIKLAIDWTPNINHIGFYIALEKKYYLSKNIDLKIISPSKDNYNITPAKKIEKGLCDFGLCPTETLISFRTKNKKFDLVALMSIFQKDVSAIAVSEKSKINRPKDLDNKTYASYGARYEDLIIKQLIINDGGKGKINVSYPKRLGVWDTVLKNKYDSTWIFLNWEGIEKPDLKFFKMEDYKIPYSYSPLVVTSKKFLNNTNPNIISDFIKMTKAGYIFSLKNIDESTEILKKYIPENNKVNLKKSLEFSANYFGDDKNFGKIDLNIMSGFIDWLEDSKIEEKKIDINDLIYNVRLKSS